MQVPQMQGSFGSSGLSKTKTSRRKGACQVLPGFLQSTFSGPKAQQQLASNLRPKQTQSFPGHKYFQDGNPRDYPVLSPKRGMGHIVGFQRHVFPHSHSPEVQEVPKISPKQGQLSVHIPSLWFGNGPVGIHQSGQGGQANGSSKGYQDPPVPRLLVVTSPFPGNLPTRYPDPLGPLPRVGLDGKHGKVGTDSSAGFQFRRLLIRPDNRPGLAHSGPVVNCEAEGEIHQGPELLHGQTVHVPYRPSYSDSLVRSASHEAHSVAPEATLACSGDSGQDHSGSPCSPPSPGLVAGREKCAATPTFAPSSSRSASVYRRIKRREAFGQNQEVAST